MKIEWIITIVAMLLLLLAVTTEGAQAACVELPGVHEQEMVKDCGDTVYIQGHYTVDQLKVIREHQRSRNEAIKKIVIGEVRRNHEIEVKKQMIEVQTRLAEASAPKIYIGANASANGGTIASRFTDSTILSQTSNVTNRQTQSLRSDPNVTTTSTATSNP